MEMTHAERALLRAHDLLPGKHAFDCTEVFLRAYHEAESDGESLRRAYATAVRKHRQAVQWVYDNVGLD